MAAAWCARTVLIATYALMLVGCASPPATQSPEGVQLTPLKTISTFQARILLTLAGVKGIAVSNPVDCYRMQYPAVGRNGEIVQLSGLLALPRGVAARRLVSFQHGTTTTRSAVPSRPDGTGIAAAIVFAGNGYALIAPDYPGLGESEGRHPYYVADSIAPAVVAMIETAQRVRGVPDAPVFLSGFSEGGWASLAALRLLETRGKQVLASAQVAGAYDLRRLSLPTALTGGAPSHSLYLAYAAWGQSAWYGQPLDSVLTRDNAQLVERLFAGAKPDEIVGALPKDPRKLFNDAFLNAFDHGNAHWYLDAFAANSLVEVTPRAPVRLYYGSMDRDVNPEEALAAARSMRARGADVTAIDVGPVGHDPSMLAAAPLILKWLAELEAGQTSAVSSTLPLADLAGISARDALNQELRVVLRRELTIEGRAQIAQEVRRGIQAVFPGFLPR
jgi:pimeloyl-ACP methyl ester carboxylesterase